MAFFVAFATATGLLAFAAFTGVTAFAFAVRLAFASGAALDAGLRGATFVLGAGRAALFARATVLAAGVAVFAARLGAGVAFRDFAVVVAAMRFDAGAAGVTGRLRFGAIAFAAACRALGFDFALARVVFAAADFAGLEA